METIRIQNSQTERIEVLALNTAGLPVTGLSDVLLGIRRISDGFWLDFNDNIFKNSGWTTRQVVMTEIDATNDAGKYKYDFDTTGFDDDTYQMRADCASADNFPQTGELKVGDYVDNLDVAVSSRPTVGEIADGVADEVFTAATHNVPNSFAKRLRNLSEASILDEGTLQGATANTVILNGSANPLDDFYKHTYISIVSGLGAGQGRIIEDYNGTTKVGIIVTDEWVVIPDDTSDYIIYNYAISDAHEVYNNRDKTGYSLSTAGIKAIWDQLTPALTVAGSIGKKIADWVVGDVLKINTSTTAADKLGASANTIVKASAVTGTLSPTEMTTNLTEVTDDHYNGRRIIFTSGELKDQATAITDYDGATKKITMIAVTSAPADGDKFNIV